MVLTDKQEQMAHNIEDAVRNGLLAVNVPDEEAKNALVNLLLTEKANERRPTRLGRFLHRWVLWSYGDEDVWRASQG